STLPQSIIPVPSQYGSSVGADSAIHDSQVGDLDLDLDLDNPEVGMPSQPAAFDATESYPPRTGAAGFQQSTHKMPLTSNEAGASGPDTRDTPLAFDLSGITLDLDKQDDTAAGGIDSPFVEDDSKSDPLSRKLELAEEFQRIGDKDGARDLLREVLATASGAAKTKAQGMLDDLS
ncbi:MAG: FimV/HubP family polar landmark protein, partial [Caldimonas sp.]